MSIWNSKHAILRDLSLAQGSAVPTDLNTTIGAGDRPPVLSLEEEDDYFQYYFGDHEPHDGSAAAPDCNLILQMLDMALHKELVDTTPTNNVSYNPSDIMLPPPVCTPTVMFKRKSESPVKVKEEKPPEPKKVDTVGSFKPSTKAKDYCQKYTERNKLKELAAEDVWSRASRMMQEIDERKKLKAEREKALAEASEISMESSDPKTSSISAKFQSNVNIGLPAHRHLLTGDCLVCQIFKKNGIDIDYEGLCD